MPHSPTTLATAGLILSLGSVPGERARTSLGVVVEQGAGHLAAARVVNTDEQHFGNVVQQAPLLRETWPAPCQWRKIKFLESLMPGDRRTKQVQVSRERCLRHHSAVKRNTVWVAG
jgi:hypothetical protein